LPVTFGLQTLPRRYHNRERHDAEPRVHRAAKPATRCRRRPCFPAAGVFEFDPDAASAGLVVFEACESESSPASGEGTGEGSGAGRRRRVLGRGGARQVELSPPNM